MLIKDTECPNSFIKIIIKMKCQIWATSTIPKNHLKNHRELWHAAVSTIESLDCVCANMLRWSASVLSPCFKVMPVFCSWCAAVLLSSSSAQPVQLPLSPLSLGVVLGQQVSQLLVQSWSRKMLQVHYYTCKLHVQSNHSQDHRSPSSHELCSFSGLIPWVNGGTKWRFPERGFS